MKNKRDSVQQVSYRKYSTFWFFLFIIIAVIDELLFGLSIKLNF